MPRVGGPRGGAARPASARARVLCARRRGPAHRGARGCRPGRVGALRVRRRGVRGRCGVGPHWGVRQRRQVELEDAPGTLLIFFSRFRLLMKAEGCDWLVFACICDEAALLFICRMDDNSRFKLGWTPISFLL